MKKMKMLDDLDDGMLPVKVGTRRTLKGMKSGDETYDVFIRKLIEYWKTGKRPEKK